jgi:hypothetical protein
MRRQLQLSIATVALFSAFAGVDPAYAQKRGGILKSYSIDSPASMSAQRVDQAGAQPRILETGSALP